MPDGKAAELLRKVTYLDLPLCIACDGLLVYGEAERGEVGEGALDV